MPSASIKKKISCSKINLIDMVLDINKYPEFLPGCLDAKVYSKIDNKNKIELTADLTIGKSFFRETYKSLVIYNKSLDTIDVTSLEGPLKYLENKWYFKQSGKNSEIDFYVNFELKNKILNLFMSKYFNIGLNKIANAFEKRAIDLFNKV